MGTGISLIQCSFPGDEFVSDLFMITVNNWCANDNIQAQDSATFETGVHADTTLGISV